LGHAEDESCSILAFMVTSDMQMTVKAKQTVLPSGEFKAKCLALLDDVERGRRTLVVTKRGRPVAQVVPLPKAREATLLGSLVYEEDPLAPVDVAWDANA
jgi:prevent-host-death family protein